MKHQLSEAHARIADLEDDVKKRDVELSAAAQRGDEESAKLATTERARRELQTQLDELKDDYDNEKSTREKIERAKRELETVSSMLILNDQVLSLMVHIRCSINTRGRIMKPSHFIYWADHSKSSNPHKRA